MNNRFSRRDFLKLTSLIPLGLTANPLLRLANPGNLYQAEKKNILIIVFDAFSAYNISMHGYKRETAPNITRLAERALVYHNHFAGGNFTTPGTASLLTGVLPWTHRAFNPGGQVSDSFIAHNLFSAFKNHYRISYSHNTWVNILLNQFRNEIDELIPRENLLLGSNKFIHKLFRKDDDVVSVSWNRLANVSAEGYAYSLFLSHINEYIQDKKTDGLKSLFPRGIPNAGSIDSDDTFLLEQAVDYIKSRLTAIPQPFFGYFHFLPPHDPYRSTSEFTGVFQNDGFTPIDKPMDIFYTRVNQGLEKKRTEYDEFILYCDKEFGRLFEYLDSSGILENTWVILTSDHGEMNERGISGHSTNALYQPVIRIPLMIFEPGRSTRMDIHENTSAIDILPTLIHITGQQPAEWTEGRVLPPFSANDAAPNRGIYVMRANDNLQYAPITQASTMLVRDNYKLLYYFGYRNIEQEGLVKLFDIRSDPEEMNDLLTAKRSTAMELLQELKNKISEVNIPYL